MKQMILSLTVLALAGAPLAAHAAPCRDAHGRFVACAKPAAAMHPAAHATPAPHVAAAPAVHPVMRTAAKAAPKRCKIGGRFASCSAPGAKPA